MGIGIICHKNKSMQQKTSFIVKLEGGEPDRPCLDRGQWKTSKYTQAGDDDDDHLNFDDDDNHQDN